MPTDIAKSGTARFEDGVPLPRTSYAEIRIVLNGENLWWYWLGEEQAVLCLVQLARHALFALECLYPPLPTPFLGYSRAPGNRRN